MPCSVPGSWTHPFAALPREAVPALALVLGSINALPVVLAAAVPAAPEAAASQPPTVAAVSAPPGEGPAAAVVATVSQPSESNLPGDPVAGRAGDAAGLQSGATGTDRAAPQVLAQAPPQGEAVSGAVVVAPAQAGGAMKDSLGTGFRFTVAPVRWNGNLAYNLAWTRADDAPTRVRHVQTGNLRGATYIWQPWFAQLNGSVGFVTGTERSSGEDFGTNSSGRDTSLTGSLGLSLFPSSRFPFSAAFERSDSRSSGAFVSSDFKTTRLSLRQDYTPLRAPFSFSGGWDRSIIEDSLAGRDTVDVLRGTANWRGDRQSASVNYSHIQNQGEEASQTRFDILNMRHNWQPGPQFGLDSTANITRSQIRAPEVSGVSSVARVVTFDAGSSAYWRPETENPLSFSGFFRVFRASNDTGGASNDAQSITAGVGTTYSPSTNLALSANGQIARVRTGDENSTIGLLTGGATYSGDPRKFGEFDYTWNTSATGTLETGGGDGNSTTITLNGAHGVNRNYLLSERSTVTLSVFQNVGAIRTSAGSNTVSLGHSVSSSWIRRQSESFVMTVSAGASDSRFFGDSEGSFQQLSMQLNGSLYLSRYSSATAALSVQATRQETGQSDGGDGGFVASAYGTLAYQHMRAFGVPQLRYSALYTANTQELGSRRQGNLAALPQGSTHALEQRLDYRIGRLDLQALLRFSIIEGKNNSFLFLSINREFGAM